MTTDLPSATAALPRRLRALLRAYPWRRLDPVPRAVLGKEPSRCRVALVSSAGLVVPGDRPFDPKIRGGDWSFRVVPASTPVQSLEDHHRSESFDHRGIAQDKNLAFPLDRLHALERQGLIGEVAPRHVSLMGSITAPGRLRKRTAPQVAALLAEDHVDLALLVPV